MTRRLFSLIAVALLVASCSKGETAPTSVATIPTTTTTLPPTTTTKPIPMPLTGLPKQPGEDPTRPVVGVKVENDPVARPLAGFEKADVVYEEEVEGGYTRFILLFQSEDADIVGSVRSVRPVDPDILVQYGHPILAASGGIPTFENLVVSAGIVGVFESADGVTAGALTRRSDRYAPHNLYANISAVREFVAKSGQGQDTSPPPANLFPFGARELTRTTTATTDTVSATVSGATKATSAVVHFGSQPMEWSYEQGRWVRYDGVGTGDAFVTEEGSGVTGDNIAIMSVNPLATGNVDPSGADVPSWEVVGTGPLTFLTSDGHAITGTWSRPSLEDVTKFLDGAGKVIPFTPGRTWIQLLPEGRTVDTSA